MVDRERAGREAIPTAGVVDSQSVKVPAAKARGTGNLKMARDFVMDNFDDTIMFGNRGGLWLQLSREVFG